MLGAVEGGVIERDSAKIHDSLGARPLGAGACDGLPASPVGFGNVATDGKAGGLVIKIQVIRHSFLYPG